MKMKTFTTLTIFLCMVLSIWTLQTFAQCTPMGPEECPDPENNGEICPDTLPIGFLNQPYEVVATILPPTTDTVEGIPIQIHHIVLDSVANLPTGLTWESNVANNEFYPENYYCILMQGTPSVADTFYLQVLVDVFVNVLGFPVYGGQVVDSTSLAIVIVDNTGIIEDQHNRFYIRSNYPNPFTTWTSIRYYAEEPGPVEFELYSLLGELVDSKSAVAQKGESYFHYLGGHLAPGTYFYLLKSGQKTAAGKMVRGK